jgi:hypothetical protein
MDFMRFMVSYGWWLLPALAALPFVVGTIILPPNSSGTTVGTVTVSSIDYPVGVNADPVVPGTNQQRVHNRPNGIFSAEYAAAVMLPETWGQAHTPTTATQATTTKAAAGAGIRHVAESITFSCAVNGTNAQTAIQVNLRDGASGAGTILWSTTVLMTATEAMKVFSITGLRIFGTAATAMTLEFSAAGVTGSVQSVSLSGFDVGAT